MIGGKMKESRGKEWGEHFAHMHDAGSWSRDEKQHFEKATEPQW